MMELFLKSGSTRFTTVSKSLDQAKILFILVERYGDLVKGLVFPLDGSHDFGSRYNRLMKIMMSVLFLLLSLVHCSSKPKATVNNSGEYAEKVLDNVRMPAADMPTEQTANIVYIGDSHSYGGFGLAMDEYLRVQSMPNSDQTIRMQTSATCGSSSGNWLAAQHSTSCGYRTCQPSGACQKVTQGTSLGLSRLLEQAGPLPWPQMTVIALGTNMLRSNIDNVMRDVSALIQKVRAVGSLCVWVGPPQAKTSFISQERYQQFISRLQDTVVSGSCRYIDSSTKTDAKDTHSDGVHYQTAAARAWGTKVAQEVYEILRQSQQ